MQIAARRFIVVSVISLIGVTGGVVLGNFVAKGPSSIGADELANLASPLLPASAKESEDASYPHSDGPTSYVCDGCDASPHNDIVGGDDVAAIDLTPMPPYQVDDPVPARSASAARPDGASVAGQRQLAVPAVTPVAIDSSAVSAPDKMKVEERSAPPLPR